jgi:hypothetical protein
MYLNLKIRKEASNIQRVKVMVFSATFNNMSVISRRSDLLVEETGVPATSH